MSESILIEVYPYNPATTSIITVGFAKGLTRTKVAGSNIPYNLRLNSTFSHDVSVYENDLPSGAKISIGSVSINNADGKFDYLFGYEWGARQIKVYRGWNAKQFSDYTLIFDGSVMAVNADRTTITFTVTEKASLIPEVLQTNTYTGAGGAGGYADLKGVAKPLCFGYCKNIKPILIDPVKQIWQVHDGTIEDIEGVYDGGVPLTKGASVADLTALINDANKPDDGSFRYTLSGYFRLGAPPAKFINADVRGEFYSEVNLPDTLREIILSRTSLTAGDLDGTSFNTLAALYPGRCSGLYYPALDVGFVEWLENCISALDSFWYFNSLGDLVVKPFAFSTPVATIRNDKINNMRRESSSRPLKEVEVLYDRNSEVIPSSEFTLVVQDLNVYVENTVIRIATDGAGAGGTYSYTDTVQAVMNGEEVSDLGAVTFYCAASWLSISPDGTFTITDPGTAVAYADVTANFGEYSAGVTITLLKSMGASPFKNLTLASTDNVFNYDQNGYPINPSENCVITATKTNVTGTLVWTAVNNVGGVETLAGTGDSRTLTASNVNNGPLIAYVDVRATAPDGTWNETRVILSRGSTGYFNPLADLLTLADSKVDVFYQTTAPSTGMNEGDLWFDTDDGNKLYRRVSGSWVFINDDRIAQAITDAATAQGVADGKITLYNSTSTPTATALGDLWYNPTTKAMRTWNGSTWELSADITGFNVAASITGQGALATLNSANWASQVIGTGKPANNAGTTLNLYASSPSDYLIYGNEVERIGSSGWDSCVFSRESYTGSFSVSARFSGPSNATMFGVTDSPGAGNYPLLDYAWYGASTNSEIYESGVAIGSFGGTYTADDLFTINYDSVFITYLRNGVEFRKIAVGPDRKFYAAVVIFNSSEKLPGIIFGPYNDAAKSPVMVNPLTLIGSHSQIVGNSIRKMSGTHGAVEGGVYGTPQKGTAFISARPVQDNTWGMILALDPTSPTNIDTSASGCWNLFFTSSNTNSNVAVYKNGALVDSWNVGSSIAETDRAALVFNGRRVFAMVNGVVYGGNTSSYDVTPNTTFWPKCFDYYLTAGSGFDIADIRYGSWSDVRTYLDDGYSILNQAGFKTDEGTASAIAGQAPAATDATIETGADVTSQISGPSEIVINADYTGVITTSLPKLTNFTLFRNGTNVTASASWSVSVLSGTMTASFPATGQLSITTSSSVIASGVVRITATYLSRSRSFDVNVNKVAAPPPVGSGGSAGSTQTTSSLFGPDSSTPEVVHTPAYLEVTAGPSGVVTLSAPLSYEIAGAYDGDYDIALVWQKWNGSSWSNIGTTALASSPAHSDPLDQWPGYVDCSYSDTGHSPGSTHRYRLTGYNPDWVTTVRHLTGTIGASGS